MQNLLLLHGAIGAADQLAPLANELKDQYRVYTMNFSGHGGQPFRADEFSIPMFADEVVQFIETEGLGQVSIFGYSMGGYVAMYLALHRPELVQKVITLATKFYWDEAIAAKEVQMLNPDKIEQKLPAFATSLKSRHAPNNWKDVLLKTSEMMIKLGGDNYLKISDYRSILSPVLLLLGDRDKMITLEETVEVYKALPNAQMAVLPGTAHPIEQVNTAMQAYFITQFLR